MDSTIQALLREEENKLRPRKRKRSGGTSKKRFPKAPTEKKKPRNREPEAQTTLQETVLPQISRQNWENFENNINHVADEVTEKLEDCIARMQYKGLHNAGNTDTLKAHIFTLHLVRSALLESILNRKWDNMLRLVIMFSRNYMDDVFRIFIRHLCQILKHYHPAIRGTELEEQIDLILENHDKSRKQHIVGV